MACKFFTCFMVDEATLEKGDPLAEALKKSHAPSFAVFHGGELLYATGDKPSASKAYSVLKQSLSKLFGVSIDKPVKEALDLKREMDKLDDAKKELDKKMAGLDPKDRRLEKYQQEKEELLKQESSLKAQEEVLYNLPDKEVAKK